MQTRHVGNNWVPLLCLAALLLFAGAVSMMADRGNGSSASVFVVGTLIAGGISAAWLWRNPSWWVAPRNNYLYLAGGALLGVVLSSFIPFLNGCGPWVVLGAALGVYGYFERLRLLVTAGCAVFVTGFLAMVVAVDVWGGAMHLVAATFLAFSANRLFVLRHGRRRESLDSDPGFVGLFEEFDNNERPNFWSSSK